MILLHAFLGVLVYFVPFLSKICCRDYYIFAYYIVSSNNRQQQANLYAAALMGSEVL
jgi:hypothetical protein